jgi:hypothetical protein
MNGVNLTCRVLPKIGQRFRTVIFNPKISSTKAATTKSAQHPHLSLGLVRDPGPLLRRDLVRNPPSVIPFVLLALTSVVILFVILLV